MSARDAAHSLASPQRLLDQTNLLVVTPSAPTFSAQDLHLHSPHDLKARLKVKSSDEPPNRTRRPPPERYREPSNAIVSTRLGVGPHTIGKWRKRFIVDRIE